MWYDFCTWDRRAWVSFCKFVIFVLQVLLMIRFLGYGWLFACAAGLATLVITSVGSGMLGMTIPGLCGCMQSTDRFRHRFVASVVLVSMVIGSSLGIACLHLSCVLSLHIACFDATSGIPHMVVCIASFISAWLGTAEGNAMRENRRNMMTKDEVFKRKMDNSFDHLLDVEPDAVRVITCCPQMLAKTGDMTVSCTDMAGNELAVVQLEGGRTCSMHFRNELATRLGIHAHQLALVLPDGTLLQGGESLDAMTQEAPEVMLGDAPV